MTRRRKLLLAAALGAAALTTAFLWALPEILRRVALDRIPALTGRAASIEDIDLNLITGSFAIKDFRLAERPGPPGGDGAEPFLRLERVEGRLSLPWLVRLDIRLRWLSIVAPDVRVVRTGPDEYNVSDLLALMEPADPPREPSRWSVTVDRIELRSGQVMVVDRAVSPAADWSLTELAVDAWGATTAAGRPPGRAEVRSRLGAAALDLEASAFRLTPAEAAVRARVAGFDLTRIGPYLPPEALAAVEHGTFGASLDLDWRGDEGGPPHATVRGEMTAEGLALVHRRAPVRFAEIRRLSVRIGEADLLGRDVVLAAIDVDRPDLRLTLLPDGRIDLLAAADGAGPADPAPVPPGPAPGAAAPAPAGPEHRPAPAAPASGPGARWRVLVERFALREGAATYIDEMLSPARETALEGLAVQGRDLSTSPVDPPGRLALNTAVTVAPGGTGPFAVTVDAEAVRFEPLFVAGQISVSDLDLRVLAPILAEDFPVVPAAGVLDVSLELAAEEDEDRTRHAWVSGTLRLSGAAFAGRGQPQPFAHLPELAVVIRQGDLLTQILDIESVELDGVALRAVRAPDGAIDLLALVAPAPGVASRPGVTPPEVASHPRRPINKAIMAAVSRPWSIALERLVLRQGSATFEDRAVSPAREWLLRALAVDGTRLSTAPGSPAGQLRLRGEILAGAAGRGPAALDVDASSLHLAPPAVSARVSLQDFSLAWAAPYVPGAVAALPSDGTLGLELRASVAQGTAGFREAVASGTARLEGVAVTLRDAPEAFLTVPSVAVALQNVDAVGQAVHLVSVTVQGLDLRAIRDAAGRIDLLELAGLGEEDALAPAAAAESTPAVAGSPGAGGWALVLDRLDLLDGTATFEDRAVEPLTVLPATDLTATVERVTWPVTGPTTWKASLTMPGGGRTEIEGDGVLDPVRVQIALRTRDAPIEPYGAYFPFAARFRGLFSGESVNEIEDDGGVWRAASRGTAWAREVEVWEPGGEAPDIRLEGVEIRGIDFSWPSYALIDGVTFDRPRVRIERDRDGVFNLRRLFGVPDDRDGEDQAAVRGVADGAEGASSPADGPIAGQESESPGASDEAAPPGGIVIDFREVVIDGGSLRFLDRTTSPAFSQEMSDLQLRIRELSNTFGRQRTALTASAVVGGDAGLDLRGELSGIGETLRADLVGELRDYPLATANPYAESVTSWTVERGKLGARIHYRVEGDVVTAEHDVTFGGLQVRRAQESDDEIKNRIGLPLGLIVSLLKDTRGDIDFAVPLTASIRDRAVDWTEAAWSGVKQAILKLLVGPFRAIGRAVRGGEEEIPDLAVNPVTFAAGSSVVAPDMEAHLTRVADFLRRAPYVSMTLRPMVTEADVESLKVQALTARIQALQRERKLEGFPAAVTVYYRERELPVEAAKTAEQQLRALVRREPVDEARVQELLDRRLAAAREALVRTEGIPAERLVVMPPPAEVATSGAGRVEFAIAGAE